MKYSFLVSMALSVLLGFLFSEYILKGYEKVEEPNNVYFLRCKKCEDKVTSYLKTDDNKEYVGITSNKKNSEKIKEMFKENDIELDVEERVITNDNFLNELTQYDVLLKNSKNISEVNSVLSTIMSTYEELVINEN